LSLLFRRALLAQGIHVTAYSPLGTPDSASMMKRDPNAPSLLQDDTVKRVADKLGKAPAQVGSILCFEGLSP